MLSAHRIEDFRRGFIYDAWANARVAACLAASAPTDAARSRWNHIIDSKRVWLARVRGDEVDHVASADRSFEEAAALLVEVEAGWAEVLSEMSGAELDRVVTFHNRQGVPQADTLSDILQQVALHGAYHRGQIVAMAKASGATPPATDFIVFAREQNRPPGDSRKMPAVAFGRTGH
ncbi:MAG: DinB family protein [Planctomycetes bacterium]|nr:DinB family protein [Planctomycetota bacterium]